MAQGLGVVERVATYTTYYPSDFPPRLTNIHRAADLMDHTLVLPGRVFSLNRTVGERTEARGFAAGFIINNGQLEVDFGGGVSQLATTTFNAAYFAGLDLVEHHAHSFYISRYPEGRDATVAWGFKDLRFRNDSPHGVFITTAYTNSSVTVTIYGTKRFRIESVKGPRYDVKPFKVVDDQRPRRHREGRLRGHRGRPGVPGRGDAELLPGRQPGPDRQAAHEVRPRERGPLRSGGRCAVAVGVVGDVAERVVELERRRVGRPHLQVRRGGALLLGPAEQGRHHRRADALPPGRRRDVHRRDAGPVALDRDPADADRLVAAVEGREADPVGAGEDGHVRLGVVGVEVVHQRAPVAATAPARPRRVRSSMLRVAVEPSKTAAIGATCTTVTCSRGQPWSAITRLAGSASGSCSSGGRPRSAYQDSTARSASGTGSPGSPTAIAELARPVMPPCARSAQSPSSSVSRAGQPAQQIALHVVRGHRRHLPAAARGRRRHHLRGGHVGGRQAQDLAAGQHVEVVVGDVEQVAEHVGQAALDPAPHGHPPSHVLAGQHVSHPSVSYCLSGHGILGGGGPLLACSKLA